MALDGLAVHFRQLYSKHYFKAGQRIVLEFCGQHFFGTFIEIELASIHGDGMCTCALVLWVFGNA